MSEHDTPMDGLTVPPAPETQDAPAPEASAPAKKPRSGRRPAKASSPSGGRNAGRLAAAPVLGVHVTSQSLYGVLLRPTADGFEPIRQFSRQRASSAAASAPELASLAELGIASTPDMLGPQTDDGVTIKFGDSGAGGGSELFLESELREIGA
ncbi:MAG TPA: hypothetical protein VD962_07310, partial [Rubricoccaceae bacterium]|nr:hypothetical protein [Rubricoccaceae bacterium]